VVTACVQYKDTQGAYLFHVILTMIIDYFRIRCTNREEGGGMCGESRLLQGEEEEENCYCSEGHQAVPTRLSGKDRL